MPVSDDKRRAAAQLLAARAVAQLKSRSGPPKLATAGTPAGVAARPATGSAKLLGATTSATPRSVASPARPGPPPTNGAPKPRPVTTGSTTRSMAPPPRLNTKASATSSPPTAKGGSPDRLRYVEVLNGFGSLVTAAINDDGKTLDTVHFDSDLKPADRSFLEQIRKVFIQAQAGGGGPRQAAAAWPPIEAKLHQMVAEARTHGLPVEQLDTTEDNIAAVAEGYIKAAHKGPTQTENPKDYKDFMDGVIDLVNVLHEQTTDLTDGVKSLDRDKTDAKQRSELNAVKFGGNLSTRHRELLEAVRHVFVLARTEGGGRQAVTEWDRIVRDLHHVFARAPEFGLTRTAELGQELDDLAKKLVHGSAYNQAHQKALASTGLENPSDKLDAERFREAVDALQKADELVKKGEELTGKALLTGILEQKGIKTELVGQIFEAVHSGFEIKELMEEFKKKGLIGKGLTIVGLTDKIVGATKTLFEGAFTEIKEFAEQAAKTGAEELAEQWESIGKWADGNLKTIEKFGKVATWIAVGVSAIKVVNHLIHGRILEAVKEAASTAIGIGVGVAAGAAGTAMFAGISFAIAAEIEGLKGAGAMIAYAREENMKSALGAFFGLLESALQIEAAELVAHLQELSDPANNPERKMIEEKLASDEQWWARHLSALSAQVDTDRKDRLGGQPECLEHLGSQAESILRVGVAASTAEGMGRQVQEVFAGANALARWVAAERSDQHQKEEEERRRAEEEEKE